jgi:hypothetical protein
MDDDPCTGDAMRRAVAADVFVADANGQSVVADLSGSIYAASGTVPIGSSPVDGQLVLDTIRIGPIYKEARRESMEGTAHRHRVTAHVRHLAAGAEKAVVAALRDVVVMVAGDAAKPAFCG